MSISHIETGNPSNTIPINISVGDIKATSIEVPSGTITVHDLKSTTIENSTLLTTTDIKITDSPSSGFVLTSDASGNGTWQALSVPPRPTIQTVTNASPITLSNGDNTILSLTVSISAGQNVFVQGGFSDQLTATNTATSAFFLSNITDNTASVTYCNMSFSVTNDPTSSPDINCWGNGYCSGVTPSSGLPITPGSHTFQLLTFKEEEAGAGSPPVHTIPVGYASLSVMLF